MVKRNSSLIVTLAAAMTIISVCAVATPMRVEAKSIGEYAEEHGLDAGGIAEDQEDGLVGKDENGNEVKATGITLVGADAVNYNSGNYDKVGKPSTGSVIIDSSTSLSTTTSATTATMPAVRYGWAKDAGTGKWYYSADSISWVKSAWKQIGGKWYYFLQDGAMATSQTIEGYWINADGVWVK